MLPEQVICQTKYWINTFIIRYSICPFAHKVFTQNKIHFEVADFNSIDNCLFALFTEFQRLDKQDDIETSFIIFPSCFSDFDEFVDFIAFSNELLTTYNYEGKYQLASFHPLYIFENEHEADPTNFTNKSPYPMLHLIRESSIFLALKNFPSPEKIPLNNIALTTKIGRKKLQQILNISLKQ